MAVIQTTKARLNHCLGRVLTTRCSRTSQERGETPGDAARVFPLPSLVLVTWDPWPYLPPHSCRPQSHHIATWIWCFNHRVWLTLVLSVTRIQKPVPDRSQISLSGATASEVWLASLVGTPSQDPPPPTQDFCWETQAPWLRQCFLRTWVEHQGQLQFFSPVWG